MNVNFYQRFNMNSPKKYNYIPASEYKINTGFKFKDINNDSIDSLDIN